MILRKKIFTFFIIFFLAVILFSGIIFAQESTPTPTPASDTSKAQQDLQNRINELQAKIRELQGQGRTLFSQIGVMDNQIKLTELRINATKGQIASISEDIETATKKIESLEEALKKLTKVLMNRIVATYEVGTTQPFYVLLTSENPKDFLTRLSYLKVAQENDKKLIFATQQAKNDYVTQKNIFEDKKKKVEALKKQLEGYTAQLAGEKQAKQALLDATKNDEKRYQTLLAEAQAQIRAFKSFASSQGGPQILPPQPSPDGWYYNQRDERWGRNLIGSSPEQVWEVGCLVTSTAMVRKQRGENVTPADIARESYFFATTAMMNIPWNGGKFTSNWSVNLSVIDSKLSSGQPVIVGLNAGPYGTHFIVLKSGANGDYVMNDPWHGPNLKFSDHYSTSQIFQYGFYNG